MGCSTQKAINTEKTIFRNKLSTDYFTGRYDNEMDTETNGKIISSRCAVRRTSKVIHIYNLGVKLGCGTHGETRVAVHLPTGQKRVIKIIEKARIKTPEEQEIFLNEIKVLQNLDHPNIVKIFEYYEDDENYHIVTEYISGGELFDHISKSKNFSEATASNYASQALSALSYIHSLGIIHKAIEPRNILIDSSSSETLLKLVNFSFSSSQSLQKPAIKSSSAQYLAPEVFVSSSFSSKSDIWSLGCVLYLLLSGQAAFQGNYKELKNRVLRGASFSQKAWDSISIEGKTLVKKMLEVKTDKRITAAEALRSPWLTRNLTRLSIDELMNSLKLFYTTSKIQRILLNFIINQVLSKDEHAELYKKFREIDRDQDGKISLQELYLAYSTSENHEQASLDAKRVMQASDANRSGYLDYSEFVTGCAWKNFLTKKEKILAGFKIINVDESGMVSKNQFEEMLGNVCDNEKVVEKLIKKIDLNGDGMIDLDEFERVIYGYLRDDFNEFG